jgi:precorrin-3B synthase
MSVAMAIDVRGWCPGILQPMQSGDGLIVRVRPHGGAFALNEARVLADLAARLGNGHVDLTRRANLQLRGLSEEALPELQAALGRLGLVDAEAEVEAVRNVMVAPLARTMRPVAEAIEQRLVEDARLRGLPAKFGVMVDEGGPLSIAGERADVALRLVGRDVAVGLDTPEGTRWLGLCDLGAAAAVAVTAMHAFLACMSARRMRDLPAEDHAAVVATLAPKLSPLVPFETNGTRRLGLLDGAVGIAAPFGRLEAAQLRRLADLVGEAGATELRLSPWRAIYVEASPEALLRGARDAGLIVDEDDPILRIEACPGAPDCKSASVDARGDARRLAAHGFTGSIHVSGCAKGCARTSPSDLVLVGEGGRYRLAHNATAQATPERMVDAADIVSVLHG